jgi:hypothetical protein
LLAESSPAQERFNRWDLDPPAVGNRKVGSEEREVPRGMARQQEAIKGSRALALPRANKTAPEGRVCAQSECETRLSRYNKRDKCWAHAEMKVPRLRGRKPVTST